MTDRPGILITAPLLPQIETALDAAFPLHRLWEAPDRAAFLAEVGPGVRGLATAGYFGRVSEDLLCQLPALEIIASFGVGYDTIDTAAATAYGVVVTNTPGVLDDEVADLTVGLLLATIRQIPQAERFVREGQRLKGAFPFSASLRGRKVGILGLGAIGKAVARRLEGFGVEIAYHGRHRQADVPYAYHASPLELARAVDTLVVLTPGGAATQHLVNAEVIDALGPQGVLVNAARGSVLDQAALVAALREGRLLAAGLDVFAEEPCQPADLLALPQVVCLPHVGSATHKTRAEMGQLLVDNLTSWFAGTGPLTPVAESRALLAPA